MKTLSTFHTIIKSCTFSFTFTQSSLDTPPIFGSSKFPTTGINITIPIKKADLTFVFAISLHILNCKIKGRIYFFSVLLDNYENKVLFFKTKIIYSNLKSESSKTMEFSQKVGPWLCSPLALFSLSFKVEHLAWHLVPFIFIHLQMQG